MHVCLMIIAWQTSSFCLLEYLSKYCHGSRKRLLQVSAGAQRGHTHTKIYSTTILSLKQEIFGNICRCSCILEPDVSNAPLTSTLTDVSDTSVAFGLMNLNLELVHYRISVSGQREFCPLDLSQPSKIVSLQNASPPVRQTLKTSRIFDGRVAACKIRGKNLKLW